MDEPIKNYWQVRLTELKNELEGNNFEVYIADDTVEAKKIVLEEILPKSEAKSVAWGGSMTFLATGLYQAIKENSDLEILDTFDKSISREEMAERRRQSLLVDLFITGTNAITEAGQLVNLDMTGNRIGGITYGPKSVIIMVGRNKVVPDLEEAMARVKDYVAPINATRLGMKTPCAKTSYCEECSSPQRICNTWTITEKCFPKGRVKIVLINQDLGF
jgi:L-lactate utilization protein LutB